jgi:hypothetical protein
VTTTRRDVFVATGHTLPTYARQGSAGADTARASRVSGGGTVLELRGDPGDIDAWLGLHDMPVTTRAGASSLAVVNIRTRAGTITIS